MSKKIFSAQDWENVPSEIQQIHTPSIAPIYNKVEEDVESVVREIEQCAIDIAPHYKDWVELGFALVDGLGENVAKQIVRARKEGEFLSKTELRKRGGVSSTLVEKMDEMGILGNMPEDNQLSLFDDLF